MTHGRALLLGNLSRATGARRYFYDYVGACVRVASDIAHRLTFRAKQRPRGQLHCMRVNEKWRSLRGIG